MRDSGFVDLQNISFHTDFQWLIIRGLENVSSTIQPVHTSGSTG